MLGAVAAHDALQFGKFLDHLGHQIALGQPRRPLGPVRLPVVLIGNEPGQRRDPITLVRDRAESLLENDMLEAFLPRCQRLLAVQSPEKFGVAEPGTNHPLVTRPHLRRITADQVGDGNEVRQQSAMPVHQRKIALMILHGTDQRLGRDVEKASLKIAGQRHRPFHQRGHFIEQFRLDDRYPAQLRRRCLCLSANHIAALAEIGNDLAGFGQLPGIIGRGIKRDR